MTPLYRYGRCIFLGNFILFIFSGSQTAFGLPQFTAVSSSAAQTRTIEETQINIEGKANGNDLSCVFLRGVSLLAAGGAGIFTEKMSPFLLLP